jgi:hypothetical protein
MAQELPAADPASPWMVHLEKAHALAHVAARAIGDESEPSPHLADAALGLARAVASTYDAFDDRAPGDGRRDRVTAINRAHGRLWDAAVLVARAGLTGALTALRDACAELILAEERFPQVPLADPPAAELSASLELLPLHVVERASLVPSFPAPPVPPIEEPETVEALPEPKTFAELAAVAAAMSRRAAALHAPRPLPAALPEAKAEPPPPPPGFALAPPPALSDGDFARKWARHCFEEIGMLGLQRTPLAGDDWRTSRPIERRLLHAVDALAALGPEALASLEPLALDAPAANPMAVFAIALVGGCFWGRDLLGSAERVLHRFGPNDPGVAAPFASALKLAPNPFVPGVLRALLASSELGCRPLAVEVLAARGWLTPAELGALTEEDDPVILSSVLPALAASRHPDLDRTARRALGHADPRAQAAALDALALAAHSEAAPAARAAAAGPLGDDALVRLAIVADLADARWILESALRDPRPRAVEAVGWSGLVDAVPALIDLLESEAEGVPLAAGAALERLLGANLVETIEVPPEEVEDVMVLDPDPDPPRGRPSLAALVSDPRDLPPAGSKETLEVASTDPEQWRPYWAAQQGKIDPRLRLRRGQGYSPSVSLYELDRLPLAPEDRRTLHRELAARTGKLTRFDTHDLVVVQEQSLVAWSQLVAATTEVPGSWERARRR